MVPTPPILSLHSKFPYCKMCADLSSCFKYFALFLGFLNSSLFVRYYCHALNDSELLERVKVPISAKHLTIYNAQGKGVKAKPSFHFFSKMCWGGGGGGWVGGPVSNVKPHLIFPGRRTSSFL